MKKLTCLFLGLFILMSATTAKALAAFSDLPETHHHYHALSYLEFEGIIQGYADGTVRPDQSINRAELVKILIEGLEHPSDPATDKECFPDVKKQWFAPYVCSALKLGWISGYPDGTFKPGQTVNKVEAIKIILNAFGIAPSQNPKPGFSDTAASDWYAGYLQTAVDKNLLEEIGSRTFNPANLRNRGEIAEMVSRMMQIQYMDDPAYNDFIRAEFQTYLYIHRLREENDVTERLKLNPILTKGAREWAIRMGDEFRELDHGLSYGRIKGALGPSFTGRTGENIGGGGKWPDPFTGIKHVHDTIFMPEPTDEVNHRTSLLSQALPFTEIGIGVYVNAEGRLFFVTDFISQEYTRTFPNISRSQYPIPAEYSGPDYHSVAEEGESNFVTMRGCHNKRVRISEFKARVDSGISVVNGQCYVWERSGQLYERDGDQYSRFAGDDGTMEKNYALSFEFFNKYDPDTKIDKRIVRVGSAPDYNTGTPGWRVEDTEFSFVEIELGEAREITLSNQNTGDRLRLKIDSSGYDPSDITSPIFIRIFEL